MRARSRYRRAVNGPHICVTAVPRHASCPVVRTLAYADAASLCHVNFPLCYALPRREGLRRVVCRVPQCPLFGWLRFVDEAPTHSFVAQSSRSWLRTTPPSRMARRCQTQVCGRSQGVSSALPNDLSFCLHMTHPRAQSVLPPSCVADERLTERHAVHQCAADHPFDTVQPRTRCS